MANRQDITGKTFGKLTALDPVKKGSKTYWRCQCDCGEVVLARVDRLIAGATVPCGRLNDRRPPQIHGMRRAPEYDVWKTMKQRCLNPANRKYPLYGGRGITVDATWVDDFLQFYKDMGPRPSAKHSIERIDNNKGYGPHNCKWATTDEQHANMRRNRLIEFRGETRTITDWAKSIGIHARSLAARLDNWSVEKALTTPRRSYPGRKE